MSRFSDQAGGTDLYVSNRTPVGNVLASPGSIAVEQTGATSKLRIHRGAGDNNTSWFPIVTGPNTTTVVNAAAVFDITTGDGINDISEVLITGGATADITIGTTSTNGTSALLFQDDVAAQTASLLFDHITNRLTLSSIDDIVIVSSGGTIDLEAFAGETINLIQAGGTANSVFEIDRTGTSGASHFWYINNVTPEGLVNGNPGDVASMVAGASSDIFMQRNSVTATTGWQGVFANLAGKMNTASSASTNALLKFSNGSGNDVEEIDWLTDSSSGSTTQLSIQHNTGVGGSTGLRFLDNGGTKFVTMALLESSQEFVVTSSLGDMILQCNRATIIRDLGGDETQQVLELDRTGTNGANSDFYISTNSAVGIVTGDPGDFAIHVDGVNSNLRQHIGSSSNNTQWAHCLGGSDIKNFGDASVGSSTATRYMAPGFDSGTASLSVIQMDAPRDGFLRSLRVRHNTTAGNGNDIIYTVRIAGVASLLTVTLASTAAVGSDTTNIVAVTEGQTIDIEITKAATVGVSPSDVVATFEIV